jgi:hypothetical protein
MAVSVVGVINIGIGVTNKLIGNKIRKSRLTSQVVEGHIKHLNGIWQSLCKKSSNNSNRGSQE